MTTIESGKRTECEGAELYYKVSDDKSTRLSDSIVDQNKTYHQSNNDFTTSKELLVALHGMISLVDKNDK